MAIRWYNIWWLLLTDQNTQLICNNICLVTKKTRGLVLSGENITTFLLITGTFHRWLPTLSRVSSSNCSNKSFGSLNRSHKKNDTSPTPLYARHHMFWLKTGVWSGSFNSTHAVVKYPLFIVWHSLSQKWNIFPFKLRFANENTLP